MKKRFTICAIVIVVVLICIAAISIYAAVTPKNAESDPSFPEEQDISLPEEEQQKDYRLDAISRLESLEKTNDPTRRFPYLEEVASGTVDPTAAKLDLETARGIISDKGEFSAIWEEIKNIQPCPDCVYGSGVSWIEYWFDETGDEKLAILLEQAQMYYAFLDPDGSMNMEVLFDPHR